MKRSDLSAYNIEGYLVVNNARSHEWNGDEPREFGGMDTAPKPKELLLSSLASCILITIRMYSERKGWDPGRIEIDLSLDVEQEKTVINKVIRFSNQLSDEVENRLLEIANRCPIAKLLTGKIEILS